MDKKLCVIVVTSWFDGCNTYFTGKIYIDSQEIFIPFQYGYGSHGYHTCVDTLKKTGVDIDNLIIKKQEITVKSKKDMIKD